MINGLVLKNRDYPGIEDGELYQLAAEPDSSFLSELFEARGHCCAFCGYRALSFLEGEPLDGDYQSLIEENWLVLCHYCRATQHVGAALRAGAYWGGIKGRTQVAVNRICRGLPWIMKRNLCPNLDAYLSQSSKVIEAYMGKGTLDMLPTHLKVLLKAREHSYAEAVELLTRNGLRLIFPYEYRPHGIESLREFDESILRAF
ncbi:hypothetical protein [Chromobacterium phragmitis]|uniref:Type IV secretion protein DotN n=1 Tax=Chromobacterium phragmitis TaxID=2202141 RepID=A0ABV0J0E7_9NEIS